MNTITDNKGFLQKLGGFAAIYGAVVYLLAIIIFLVVLDYPNISDPADKLSMIIENQRLVITLRWLSYVLFGLALVVLSFALYEKIDLKDSSMMKIATLFALIWATLLIASGLIFNHGAVIVADIYKTDPSQAVLLWQGIEVIASSLSFIDGELLGGLWMLLVGLGSLKSREFNKGFSYWTIGIGILGVISILPPLNFLGALFGIGQIFWFLWIGKIFLSKSTNEKQKKNSNQTLKTL